MGLLSTVYCDNFSESEYFHQKGVRMEFLRIKNKVRPDRRNITLGKHFISLFFVLTGEIGKLRWWWGSKYFIFLDLRQTFSNSSWLMLTLLGADSVLSSADFNYKNIRKYLRNFSRLISQLSTFIFVAAPQSCSRHREALNKMTVTTLGIKQKPIENTIKTLVLCQRKWS